MKAVRWLLVLSALGLAGCASDHVAFRTDEGLRIAAPGELERVRLPVTVSWTGPGPATGGDLKGKGPFYAVFVDRPPVRAGTSLRTLVDGDCRKQPGCPDLAWFAERFVFVTADRGITLPAVPAEASAARVGADHSHRVAVVRVDGNGVRVDEAVAAVEFTVVGG
jgi:hypothetical protein